MAGAAVPGALGLVLAFGAAGLIKVGADRVRGRDSSFCRLIERAPESIGWVYHRITRQAGQVGKGGSHAVVIHALDGMVMDLDVPAAAVEPLLRLVLSRARNAVAGHTASARASFEQLARAAR